MRGWGCGFITSKMAEDPEVLAYVLSRARAALCLSFGDPAAFAPCIRDAGVPLICQVTTLAGAKTSPPPRSAMARGVSCSNPMMSRLPGTMSRWVSRKDFVTIWWFL